MAALSTQNLSASGTGVTYAAASAGGDTFKNDASTIVTIKNSHATVARNVTLVATGHCSHGFLHNRVIAIPALGEVRIRDIDTRRFGTTVSMTYDSEANLTVAVTK